MANIKSQIKRNDRSKRERFENRHYTSAIRTYFRRLEDDQDFGEVQPELHGWGGPIPIRRWRRDELGVWVTGDSWSVRRRLR